MVPYAIQTKKYSKFLYLTKKMEILSYIVSTITSNNNKNNKLSSQTQNTPLFESTKYDNFIKAKVQMVNN